MNSHPYRKLFANLGISFAVMYAVMFLNVDDSSDIYLSLNRLYMTLLMVSPMCVIMMISMKEMYPNKLWNRVISLAGVAVFATSMYCLRTQAFISDVQYMKGMIPHHSSAIMTSKHAEIENKEVRALADSIIQSQLDEIRLMKSLIAKHKY